MDFNVLINLLRADGSITVNKALAENIGLTSALIYAELLSKHNYFNTRDELTKDGFFYCTIPDLQKSTTLGRKAQDPAIKKLVTAGLIEMKLKGQPGKRHFKVICNVENLIKYLSPKASNNNKANKVVQKEQSDSDTENTQVVQKEQSKLTKGNNSNCPKGTTNNTNNNNNNNNTKTTTEDTRKDSSCQDFYEKKEKNVVVKTNGENFSRKANSMSDKELEDLKKKIEDTIEHEILINNFYRLVYECSIEDINFYIENWSRFDCTRKNNPPGFFCQAVREKYQLPQAQKSRDNFQPIQSTNYEQREYDDDFFNSLYDNIEPES